VINQLASRIAQEFENSEAAMSSLDAAEGAVLPASAEVRAALPEKGVTVGLHHLLARSLAAEGNEEEADRVTFQLAERLNQTRLWKPLVRVVEPLLDRFPHQVAPLILRVRTQDGEGTVPDALLFRAHDAHRHHGQLAWAAAQAKLAAGDEAGAVRAAEAALPALVEDHNHDEAEECMLVLAEAERGSSVRVFLRVLEALARQDAWPRVATALDLAVDLLAAPEHAAETWPVASALWLKHPDREALRPKVVRVAEGLLAGYPDPQAIIRVSRLNIPSEDPDVSLERLRKARLFPPGYYVEHSGWGIGKIRENDIETLVIDFPTRPLHKMALATAERALTTLAPGDLRVLTAYRPAELQELVKTDPAAVVELALRRLPERAGSTEQIRKILVPAVIPSPGWAGWWKNARKAVAEGTRIDSRRAYENQYRLLDLHEKSDEVPLPEWDGKLDAVKNLAMLDTFAEHHPDELDRLVDAFREQLTELVADPRRSPEERVSASLWFTERGLPSPLSPGELVGAGFDFNALPKTSQESLLAELDGAAAWSAALDSRLAGVRRGAWERLVETGAAVDAAGAALSAAGERPEAALHVLEEGLPSLAASPDPNAKLLVTALVDLLETPPRETHRKRALALLASRGALAARLRARPILDDETRKITTRLKGWRASDKFRFPLLDYLRDAGHAYVTDEVEGHRARAAARLGARSDETTPDPYDGDLVLTRPSLDRLEAERVRLGMELKTTLPRTIQRARELGDLSENAEYHAAKAKQAEYAQRFAELENMMKRVRLIENLPRTPGVALPGTEVELRAADGGEEMTVWLLGEGDQHFGDRVVSYKAPIGLALHGKTAGDEVDLPSDAGPRRFTLTRVVEKLP